MGGWLTLLWLTAHFLLRAFPVAFAFVVVTAMLAPVVENPRLLLVIGVAVAVVPGALLRLRIDEFLERWKDSWAAPTLLDLMTASNVLVCVVIGLGFADYTGQSLRRHGDWFLGEAPNGFVARAVRSGVGRLALALETFDPPPEIGPVVAPMIATPRPGPWSPDVTPPMEGTLTWFHPLSGPKRQMPITAGRRFGAARPQPRPSECELGHCGVDLGTTLGEPVFAIGDGVIERIEMDETKGGRAGKYIRIGHRDGRVVSRYIHLDSMRADLKVGMAVRGGEMIGRLGRSGVEHSGAHLHFGLSLRGENDKETYIDPEPLLRRWQLPEAQGALVAFAR